MIAERLPELKSFSVEEKWQLVDELQEELLMNDPTMQEPLKSEIVAALERSRRHYLDHPESAISLGELTGRIRSLKK
jgi:hypothetical protein